MRQGKLYKQWARNTGLIEWQRLPEKAVMNIMAGEMKHLYASVPVELNMY